MPILVATSRGHPEFEGKMTRRLACASMTTIEQEYSPTNRRHPEAPPAGEMDLSRLGPGTASLMPYLESFHDKES